MGTGGLLREQREHDPERGVVSAWNTCRVVDYACRAHGVRGGPESVRPSLLGIGAGGQRGGRVLRARRCARRVWRSTVDAMSSNRESIRWSLAPSARHRIIGGTLAIFAILSYGVSPGRASVRHATLVRSEPAADSVMPVGLTHFRFVFSEPITAALSGASVLTADGRTIVLATAGDPR